MLGPGSERIWKSLGATMNMTHFQQLQVVGWLSVSVSETESLIWLIWARCSSLHESAQAGRQGD